MASIMENITANIMENTTETMETTRNNSRKRGSSIWKLIMAVCLLGVAISASVLLYSCYQKGQREKLLEDMAEQSNGGKKEEAVEMTKEIVGVEAELQTPSAAVSEEPVQPKSREDMSLEEKQLLLSQKLGIDIPDKELDFTILQEATNPDIYAWIYIPDTKIDYPVLQHPENNAYYLYYNIDGSKGYPGCIYSENYNKKDFSDFNTVLYGHNMKSGTMFAGLHKYEDSEYFDQHPYVYVYTAEDIFVYQIFAAYEFSNVHLLKGYDTENTKGRIQYLNEIRDIRSMNSIFDKNLEVNENSHILTMSTCISKKPDNRFLVQGVLLNDILYEEIKE